MTFLKKDLMKNVGCTFQMITFGFASGMPAYFVLSTVAIWFLDFHMTLTDVGLLSFVSIPYIFKVLLSPLVDLIRFKWLASWLGPRKSWVLAMQACLCVIFILFGFFNPAHMPRTILFLCFVMATCASLQDIVLEAYRIEIVPAHLQNMMSGACSFGFRAAVGLVGYFPLMISHYAGWTAAFWVLAVFTLCEMLVILFTPEPPISPLRSSFSFPHYVGLLKKSFIFLRSQYSLGWIFSLIASYKLADVFIRSVYIAFLLKAALYSKAEIAAIDRGLGLGAMMLGSLMGGLLITKQDIRFGMRVWAGLQLMTCLLFTYFAWIQTYSYALILCVLLNQWAGGIGASIQTAYLSFVCRHSVGVAINYSFFTSFGSLNRVFISFAANMIADICTWPVFFALSACVTVPVVWISCRPKAFHKK